MYRSTKSDFPLNFGYTSMKKKLPKSTKTGIALIKKSNDLIEARYKFDIWETRFFLSVLSKIHKDDDEFETYRIHYKDIIKTFGLKPTSSYELLRTAAKSLMDKKVTVDYEENGHKREKIYHLIRHIDLLKEGRAGAEDLEQQEYVDVVVESQMRPLLLHLQRNFTAYDLRNVVNLGVYPVRVYELLKQYERIGKRTLYIEQMKTMFNLTEEYPKFANFYQKIVAPAINEINKYTDLKVLRVDKVKDSKKVVALEFFFECKASEEVKMLYEDSTKEQKRNLTLFDYWEEQEEFEEKPTSSRADAMEEEAVSSPQSAQDKIFIHYQKIVVSDFGVSPTVFLNEISDKTEAQVQQAVRVTQRAVAEQKAKNSAAFFIDALRKGFTDPTEIKKQKQQEKQAIQQHNAAIQAKIAEIEDIKIQAIKNKVRAITTVHPEITNDAINSINSEKSYQKMLEVKKAVLQRDLSIEDFREDEVLRSAVITEIVKMHHKAFESIFTEYDAAITGLKKQLKK